MRLPPKKDLLNAIRPRGGVRIFGVGAPKTGTNSIAGIFRHTVTTAHEQDAERLIQLHLERERTGSHSRVRRFLFMRDRWRNLKIDSSHVNIYLLDDLERLFPQSRYVLTVRPPLDWVRSMIDDSLRRGASETWHQFRDYRFGAKASAKEEVALEKRGIYSLGGYLHYWQDAIERVVQRIEPDRLLVVKTEEISSHVGPIAEFCGVSANRVAGGKTKFFANPTRFGVLGEMDPDYLIDTTEKICGDLSRRLFPDYSIEHAARNLHPGLSLKAG